jgi:hypothetical protein
VPNADEFTPLEPVEDKLGEDAPPAPTTTE